MSSHLRKVAQSRAAVTTSAIGAAFERTIGPRDLDGFRWRVWVSDGQGVGAIEAQIAASEPILGYTLPVLALERVIERRAASFPAESRLADLLTEGRIQLRSSDFRDEDFE